MVKCPGIIGWKANARPPGWKVRENAPLLPGGTHINEPWRRPIQVQTLNESATIREKMEEFGEDG